MPSLLQRLTKNPKLLFFVDGIGAWFSAFLLSMVLAKFESTFGMPLNVLIILALVPGFFAFYSFACYFFLKDNWSPFLKSIAIANLLYCLVTIGLVIYHYEKLTFLGVGYFAIEVLVVSVLIVLEFKASSKRL